MIFFNNKSQKIDKRLNYCRRRQCTWVLPISLHATGVRLLDNRTKITIPYVLLAGRVFFLFTVPTFNVHQTRVL